MPKGGKALVAPSIVPTAEVQPLRPSTFAPCDFVKRTQLQVGQLPGEQRGKSSLEREAASKKEEQLSKGDHKEESAA
eukprot:1158369-Pelagomonas_calceolata.AAC.10